MREIRIFHRMMKSVARDCIIMRALWLMFLMLVVTTKTLGQSREIYDKLKNKPTTELLQIGHRYAELTLRPDSALVCFTIVANRYNTDLTSFAPLTPMVQSAWRRKL